MRRFPRAVLLTAASLFALSIAGELGLRLAEWFGGSATEDAGRPTELEKLNDLARPGTAFEHDGVLYRSNRHGFRGSDVEQARQPGTRRVIVIGDSITMGFGVGENEAYPALLERALEDATDADERVEVLNLGLWGLNLTQSVDRLERIGLAFDPDLVVYGFTLNDLEGPHYRFLGRYLRETRARTRSSSRLLDALLRRMDSLQELFDPQPGSFVHELDENYFHNPPAWNDFLAALERLASIGRERDLCVVVFLHSRLAFLHPWHPFRRHYDAVEDAASLRGLEVIGSFDAFSWRTASRLWVSTSDQHPNAEGHRILAEALRNGMGSLPAHCRVDGT